MKRLLCILLAIGISGLAYGKQEKRPSPRAQKSKSAQSSKRPARFVLIGSGYSKTSIDQCAPEKCVVTERCNPDECEEPAPPGPPGPPQNP